MESGANFSGSSKRAKHMNDTEDGAQKQDTRYFKILLFCLWTVLILTTDKSLSFSGRKTLKVMQG